MSTVYQVAGTACRACVYLKRPPADVESRRVPLRGNAHRDVILQRYPRLVAHLICKSLGYFTPAGAANAIAAYLNGHPFGCEWYYDWAQKQAARDRDDGKEYRAFDDILLEVGALALRYAVKQRHDHKGYMADYRQARMLVEAELADRGPVFASWF